MTHVTNYAKDRLASFLFHHLFKFITRWTKLELQSARPLTLAQTYFSIFPEDRVPVWTVSRPRPLVGVVRDPMGVVCWCLCMYICSLRVTTRGIWRYGG